MILTALRRRPEKARMERSIMAGIPRGNAAPREGDAMSSQPGTAARVAAAALLAAAAVLSPAQSGNDEDAVRRRIIETAESLVGVPYSYGSESPSAFDCSGFTRYVYGKASGIELPRGSRGQYGAGEAIDLDEAKPGDLLVYDTVGGAPSHVAIFLGGGRMIHAASQGPRTGVIVSGLDDSYFGPRFLGARRVLGSRSPGGPRSAGGAQAAAQGASASGGAGGREADRAGEPIGFALSALPSVYDDPIPAVSGTALSFVIRNNTGADGAFVFSFYFIDPDSKKYVPLREERRTLKAGAAIEIPSVALESPGVYRLNVKTAGDEQLMRRTWRAVEPTRSPAPSRASPR
jgi:cell wall-associated NlpC family hydrolase